jgi:hypothetical protein
MTTEYKTGKFMKIESDVKDWISDHNKIHDTLIYSFTTDDCINDFIYELEEVQMNIRSYMYPDNVIISFKNINHNPNNHKMISWNIEEVTEWGYYNR